MANIWIKRAYCDPDPVDGQRILIDRLWPRGVSKEDLKIDTWLKGIAPSDALRKWFGHDPEKWDEFQSRYALELEEHRAEVEDLRGRIAKGRVTLIYSAKDEQHNNAVALKVWLERET